MIHATVPSFAKINLDLRVLHKRPDGYHELRTIFQTISLKDTLGISYDKHASAAVHMESSVEIPDNLVLRAAQLVTDELKIGGAFRMTLQKRIPMGAGLGGGSSNAAAALIAIPALAGKPADQAQLSEWAERLGSDVAFFLQGGTALGLGRGGELYPLPEQKAWPIVLVSTGVHVSTAEAYQGLNRTLTQSDHFPILREFQKVAWSLGLHQLEKYELKNDFEKSVFERHPELGAVVDTLRSAGAEQARMTGSGSAVFGLFRGVDVAQRALRSVALGAAAVHRLLPRNRYVEAWRRALGDAAGFSIFGAAEA